MLCAHITLSQYLRCYFHNKKVLKVQAKVHHSFISAVTHYSKSQALKLYLEFTVFCANFNTRILNCNLISNVFLNFAALITSLAGMCCGKSGAPQLWDAVAMWRPFPRCRVCVLPGQGGLQRERRDGGERRPRRPSDALIADQWKT